MLSRPQPLNTRSLGAAPAATSSRSRASPARGGELIAHGSDFGAVMSMLPIYAKNLADGFAQG